jgi:hypothetical protein
MPIQDQKQMNEIMPFNLFKEIIHNKKNYKKKSILKINIPKNIHILLKGI